MENNEIQEIINQNEERVRVIDAQMVAIREGNARMQQLLEQLQEIEARQQERERQLQEIEAEIEHQQDFNDRRRG